MSRDFDIVLFGATGYTGRLTADYFARAKTKCKIAIAGRDQAKLAALGFDFPMVVCDATNESEVAALAKRARVVCTTVGPYSKYGMPLASACAEHGTDYCDLTGETPFMKDSIDANDARAQKSGARIVHACGFDSIPSDLGVFVAFRAAGERGQKLARVRTRIVKMKGGFSGGTAASMFAIAERIRDPKVRRAIGDPHALDPPGAPRSRVRDPRGPRKSEDGRWLGPFVMAAVNTRVVRRSSALLGYGPSFSYEEAIDFGRGARGFFHAAKVSTMMLGLVAIAVIPGARAIARPFAPKPGEGPTPEQRERGCFRFEIDAETDANETIVSIVEGKRDPGYAETSKMLAESAMCLAETRGEGGVLTPASSLGDALVARLRAADMTLEAKYQ